MSTMFNRLNAGYIWAKQPELNFID